ncbi:MAG TPA: CocE/NonD family hydrolase [Solirubrobacteraceae bacterium]|nr:CocE/NonD family hydrolase [Solirubrobacteraceae bacterium]
MHRITLLALLALLLVAAPAAAAPVPEGAEWTEEWIATPDGEELHADVLRPVGVNRPTPVIAIVSPYLGHSVDDGNESRDPGPSSRFHDLFEGGEVFERGYSVVMVDLRGTGGSSGCLDILGPGEQADVKAAVEWAATRPWSNGRVGMYGKSYDGNTGVVGATLQPKGLEAVVAQQVVGDRYRGSYSGGVRYLQSLAYPAASYGTQAEGGFTLGDDLKYTLNSLAHTADCQAALAGHYNPDESTDFWKVRDFVDRNEGSTVPFLMTTGFLDVNTNIGGGAIDFYEKLRGPKRLWLGWWDHVRGNDMVDDRLAMGRRGWFDEVMRFYDAYLKGSRSAQAKVRRDPPVALQGSDGRWRREAAWPPADTRPHVAPLNAGTYADDGWNLGSGDLGAGAGGSALYGGEPYTTGAGTWTLSRPLARLAHLAGIPHAKVDVAPVAPQTNLVVNVYDVAPDGQATMISRGARLVSEEGPAAVELYPTEWQLPAGHRIGVLVSGANAEAWVHVPTQTDVEVRGGTIALPLRTRGPGRPLQGAPAPRLESYREDAPFSVDPATLESAERGDFVVGRRGTGRLRAR